MSTIKIAVAMLFMLMKLTTVVVASDPIGIYALVDKVILEPSASGPKRIQVWGSFCLAKGRGFTYDPPARGYLYFSLPAGKEDMALKEWADLKAVAGTQQGVAFGSRYAAAQARLRQADEKPDGPDTYPMGFGLVKLQKDSDNPNLKALLEKAIR